MSFAVAILGLAVLILLHEAGHFFVARALGMTPRKFYLGFGPPLVKTVRNRVEYGIAAFPLGGYVKIPGMNRPTAGDLRKSLPEAAQQQFDPELEALDAAIVREDYAGAHTRLLALEPALRGERMVQELEGALSPEAYWRQKTWKRVAVIAAGPAANFVIAIVLFIAIFAWSTVQSSRTIDKVQAGHPAAQAGLKQDDTIVSIAGKKITPDTIPNAITATKGRPFTLVVRREGVKKTIGPLRAVLDGGVYRIGIEIGVTSGPGESIGRSTVDSFRLTGDVISQTVTGLVNLGQAKDTNQVSSSVGIVRDTAQAYRQSFQDFLYLVGLISLAIAILNLLPVLPLDGGHIVMALLERVRGRTFSQMVYLRYSAVGLTLFALLLYLGLRNDLFSGAS